MVPNLENGVKKREEAMNILTINLFKKYELMRYRYFDKDLFVHKLLAQYICKEKYRVEEYGIFINCISLNNPLLKQGWKIHISASNKNYKNILHEVIPYITCLNASFKVVSEFGQNIMLSKNFPREQTGKFITIYPQTIFQCRTIIRTLNKKLKKYTGIPVLTDKRISKNNEVSLRYGAFQKIINYDDEGDPIYSIINKKGIKVRDNRTVGYYKPDWITNEPMRINTEASVDNQTKSLLRKYHFIAALQFSNFGGVYEAVGKKNNEHVVIKEARKYLGGSSFADMTPNDIRAIRRREYSVLLDLSKLKVTPKPIDYFETNDGDYLVEEYINWNLLKNIRLQNPIYYPNSSEKDYRTYLQKIAKIFLNLYKVINIINAKDLVINDLTPNNVLYDPKTLNVKIIDLESCTKKELKHRKSIFVTPGYTKMFKINKISENDKFSWMMCLIDSLICRAQILNLNSNTILLSLDFVKKLYNGWSELCDYLKECFVNDIEDNYSKLIKEVSRIAGKIDEERSV